MRRTLQFIALLLVTTAPALAQDTPLVPASLVFLPDTTGPVISPHIYGHFAEHLGRDIYGGFWVGENSSIPNVRGIRKDIVDALREVGVPNIRWPGGCFADIYHWRDGIGPKEQRPVVPNRFWGRGLEDNSFGTHEFMDLAEQLGAEPYIAGNLGSGTVEEMADWAEYLTRDDGSPMAELRRVNGHDDPWPVRLFGVGNESWGCGGNMRPEYYADLFRQYATYLREYGRGLQLVAAGPSAGYGGYGDDLRWTEILMREAGWLMGGYSLHYYTVTHNWRRKGSATEFDESEWFTTLKKSSWIDSVITAHARVMDRFDPRKRVPIVMDEWGTWHDVPPDTAGHTLYQQNTLRDALVAGITLNIFNTHADRVRVANLAQTVNVLQSMVLTQEDRMVLTPTYHVFRLFRGHQGSTLIPSRLETPDYTYDGESMPALSASASVDSTGAYRITVTNVDPHRRFSLRVPLKATHRALLAFIVTSDEMQDHNTFDEPNTIHRQSYLGFRRGSPTHALLLVPPKSVITFEAH